MFLFLLLLAIVWYKRHNVGVVLLFGIGMSLCYVMIGNEQWDMCVLVYGVMTDNCLDWYTNVFMCYNVFDDTIVLISYKYYSNSVFLIYKKLTTAVT
jgi:hypothetical protein